MGNYILAIHGGAGNIDRKLWDSAREKSFQQALSDILTQSRGVLRQGGSALDAVEQAVVLLEDCELFNAGRGSVLTSSGHVEMDAAIMDGRDRRAGAVAGVRTIKNPVRAARMVMDRSPHVLIVGPEAEALASRHGLALVPENYFILPHRQEQLERARLETPTVAERDEGCWGTVGAVALDAHGHLASATSTGGIINKLPGRVGDSPLIGTGTWADGSTCAISATGDGEYFIRGVFAHEADALMRLAGLGLLAACRAALEKVRELGGCGGCIAVDARGNVAMPFTTNAMFRGWIGTDGIPRAAVFPDVGE